MEWGEVRLMKQDDLTLEVANSKILENAQMIFVDKNYTKAFKIVKDERSKLIYDANKAINENIYVENDTDNKDNIALTGKLLNTLLVWVHDELGMDMLYVSGAFYLFG